MKKSDIRILFLFWGLLWLGACTVGKKYADPVPELPEHYRNDANFADTNSVGNIPWNQFFTDPTLQTLIDSAIHRNLDLQLAIQNIKSARLLMKQAQKGYWPDIDAQVSAGILRPSDNSINGHAGIQHVEDYNMGIGISWEVDIWGKISLRKQAALSTYLQTEEAKKAIQTGLIALVASGYYNLLSMDAQVRIAQRNLSLRDSTLRIIRLQYDAGQVTGLATQEAEAQKLAAALLIPSLEQEIAIQENAIRTLCGELPAAISGRASINDFKEQDHFSTGLPAQMLSRRPDVKANEMALHAANARVGLAQVNMYPALKITASGGLNSFLFSNWFSIPASLFGLAGGSLTQPIFHRGQLKTEFELAKIDREKSVIQFRQSVLVAVQEVSDALIRIEKLKSQIEIASARASTLQQASGNAILLFNSGMANYLEVITTEAVALQSQLDVVDIRRQQLFAYIDLYRSLGGGWE